MPEDRQKLTDKSLGEFVSKVHREPELKKQILQKLETTKDVMSVVKEFFVLNDKQNENVKVSSKEMIELLGTAVTTMLKIGGKIRLLPPDFTRPQPQSAGIHVGVHNGPNGTDIDVSVHCLE